MPGELVELPGVAGATDRPDLLVKEETEQLTIVTTTLLEEEAEVVTTVEVEVAPIVLQALRTAVEVVEVDPVWFLLVGLAHQHQTPEMDN